MLPLIVGISGLILSEEEKNLFAKNPPFGIILFSRNVQSHTQLKKLTSEIKSLFNGVKIFIDEEGGRVTRLKSIFEPLGNCRDLGDVYEKNKVLGEKKITEHFREIARRLKEFDIDSPCSPVCDISFPNTHDVIGDRAFSNNANIVAQCATIASDALLLENLIPVIKHLPGHGRSESDSHLDLPIVDASLRELEESDFKVFKTLNHYSFAMTAHIIYESLDKNHPATLSPAVMNYIREKIGFKGEIMTDDISMKALQNYSIPEIIDLSFKAGIDYILHCNGDFKEIEEVITTLQLYIN
jgi:beta-glucosidase-like glycosyl hydrolase